MEKIAAALGRVRQCGDRSSGAANKYRKAEGF